MIECRRHIALLKGLLLVGMSILTGASCERRPLEDPNFNTNINVKVDIKAIQNVTCDIYNDKIPRPELNPEVLRVMFYDSQKDKFLGETFIYDKSTDENGDTFIHGNISILPGDYKILIYQFGTESSLVENYQSYEKATTYTNTISEEEMKALQLKAEIESANGPQKIHYQPDHIIAARSEFEHIPYHSGTYTISTEARSLVESYYLQIKVDGLQYVSSAKAVLTSMVSSVNISSEKKNIQDPCAIYIPLLKSDDKGQDVACNVFNTFGRIPDSTNSLKVTFELKTTDGRSINETFDISDLFLTEECIKHHWLLIDKTIIVPAPPDPKPGEGGGFDPKIDDWESINSEIII